MKTLIKSLAIAFCLVAGEEMALAQERPDYYKFDDEGILSEFQQTTPDGVKIKYNSEEKTALIIYPDGTLVDFSSSLTSSYDGPRVWPNGKIYDTNGAVPLKDWYKDIRKATSAPKGPDMLDNLFGLKYVTITFKDNAQASVTYYEDGAGIGDYTDVSESGDILSIDCWGQEIKRINLSNPKIYDTSGQVKSTGKLASGGKGDYIFIDSKNFREVKKIIYCEGQVITEEGDTFSGSFSVLFAGEFQQFEFKSPYLRTLISKIPGNLPPAAYGIDNIVGICLGEGTMVNKDNKIIAMYRNSVQLDEFDMASELAAAQGKIDKEIAAAKKAASERATITNKYGKKYADAFFAGKVIVGMPEDLIDLGLSAHSFKDFYTVALSIDRQTSVGSRQCYTLIGYNLANVGHMWITNGSVESITYY